MAVCGLVTVGLAVVSAVLLVTSYVVPGLPAIVLAVITVVMFGGLWFGLPAARRERISRPRGRAPS
jgi:hypothetical protein